jgi:hypothetical protein
MPEGSSALVDLEPLDTGLVDTGLVEAGLVDAGSERRGRFV